MGFISDNWKLLFSGTALIAFVAIQHTVYTALLKACKEFKDTLDNGASDPARGTGGFAWLQNVRTMFSQEGGQWIVNSPLPREAVIDSLDNEIWRTSRYSALQRWGSAAPLIGVILSALGFMVSPPELTGEVKDIMTKLGPLFVGVFVGALMALINLAYLHYAALELGRVRAKAVLWFDEVVWKSITQNAHNALGKATSETQEAAKYLVTSSQELATCNISYRDSLLELNRQLGTVKDAAQVTSKTFDTFSTTFGEMTEQIRASLRNLTSLNATASAVENSSAVWYAAATKVNNASTGIENSSKKMLETCANFSMNFDDVRRSMKEGIEQSTGGLLEAVTHMSEPLQKLEGSIEQMQKNTERHTELSTSLTKAVEQSDRFLLERMALNADEANLQKEMATRVRVSVDSLKQLTDIVGAVGNTGASMNEAAAGLKESSGTIGGAMKGLLETCNGFAAHCAALQSKMNSEVAEATTGLQNAARELSTPIQSLNSSISRVSTSTENQADSGNRMEGVQTQLAETARLLTESANNMRQLQNGVETLVSELRSSRANKDSANGRWSPFGWLKGSSKES